MPLFLIVKYRQNTQHFKGKLYFDNDLTSCPAFP